LGEDEQAAVLRQVLELFYSHPAVTGVTLWGFWDGHIWTENGGLLRRDWTEKPAYDSVRDFWQPAAVNVSVTKATSSGGGGGGGGFVAAWRGPPGRYRWTLRSSGQSEARSGVVEFGLDGGGGGKEVVVLL
jgi:hypothetical protein